jgi:hypothetical protein
MPGGLYVSHPKKKRRSLFKPFILNLHHHVLYPKKSSLGLFAVNTEALPQRCYKRLGAVNDIGALID